MAYGCELRLSMVAWASLMVYALLVAAEKSLLMQLVLLGTTQLGVANYQCLWFVCKGFGCEFGCDIFWAVVMVL